ncbi:MAG: ATP-binding cassette domain-containing protein [Coriobacteriales bacterium]|jgi:molybdate transport system ATP-binding protein|nr:ATP-binding cassette domain-containing protein [Coriobacteriales bacterium]
MSISVNIRKQFPNFTLDVAFDAAAETLGFLGASGCGKSLTLRCIAGLEKPDEGYIKVGERVFFDSERRINLTPQQRKTALLFQNYMLFPNMTVADNIRAGLPRGLSKQEVHEEVSAQLKRFDLLGFGHRYPMSLSGGQAQRVALARMLAAKPEILMLDEPFSALDAHLKEGLEHNLLELFEGYEGCILYVSHDIDEAFRFCDRIAIYNDGRIDQLSPAPELVSHPKTLATLKVSGVKNIVSARPLGDSAPTKVEVIDWGIVLDCGRVVAADVKWLGIRAVNIKQVRDDENAGLAATTASDALVATTATDVLAATTASDALVATTDSDVLVAPEASSANNTFCFNVRRVSDSRFERTVILEHIDEHGNKAPATINWRTPKRRDSDVRLPERGDRIKLRIPAEAIYLVSR